jgi:hypothetical protein
MFRAEFTQHGSGSGSGPRIQEIDGFPLKHGEDANYSTTITTADALSARSSSAGLDLGPPNPAC